MTGTLALNSGALEPTGSVLLLTYSKQAIKRHFSWTVRCWIHGDEIERGEPEPDIYLCAGEKLGVAADACLVIEDSLSGIAAALAAHMRVAAIPDRRFVDPREYEKETDYLLSDLSEIPALIEAERG